jgi:gamma-glutamyl hercynylcysteine S-oxide synthase
MHFSSPAEEARRCGADRLAALLRQARHDTLATFAAYEAALPGLRVPQRPEFNPPLWELGHIGWFQQFWVGRNPERARGAAANPLAFRAPVPGDAWYDSSAVPHARRWHLPLPDAAATRAALSEQLHETLAVLAALPTEQAVDDTALYFFRLALHHEDMHHEAALYMAPGLGVAVTDPRWLPQALRPLPAPVHVPTQEFTLGRGGQSGFAFDNELPGQAVQLPAFEIDAQPVRWAEFWPFAEAGGYRERRWWSEAGWAWLQGQGRTGPAVLPEQARPEHVAVHLSWHEAQAWCAWAGRCLPTEAQWEAAALRASDAFIWGQVWEWTASAFAPYPGFAPHPYRDYSAPWFDGRPVLRGGSHFTQPRLKHPRYRNYFPAERCDIASGFRTCAPA